MMALCLKSVFKNTTAVRLYRRRRLIPIQDLQIVSSCLLHDGKAMSHQNNAEIMSRIEIVDDAIRSKKIVQSILDRREPVAIDTEGTTSPTLGLIQIKTSDDRIYLFRTGINQSLFTSGGLKELLENGDITKVFHASTGDCLAIYKEGIQMWGLYDTALAHKVINYQNYGISINDNTISFSGLCDAYGFLDNPFKKFMKDQLWKRLNVCSEKAALPDDIVYYSAWDVEPLLDIYQITSSIIEPDFVPILNELCENELVRCVDPVLVKRRSTERRRDETFTVFIDNINPKVSKAAFYEVLAKHDGEKKVLLSATHRTAHLQLSSRSTAVSVYKLLQDSTTLKKFGPESQVRLLSDVKLSEIEAGDLEADNVRMKLKESNYILDPEKARKLMDIIIQAKCPVVMEFHLMNYGASVDIFVGQDPPLKFEINSDSVVRFGLGDLIASNDVTKIVGRVDTDCVQSVLKVCSLANYKPSNFFDISTSHKVVDFLSYGQSVFKSSSPSIKEVSRKLGLNVSTHFEHFLYIYFYLQKCLPSEALEFLSKKSNADLDVAANLSLAEAKETRKRLRLSYDTNAVHICAQSNKGLVVTDDEFRLVLKTYLDKNKFRYDVLIVKDLGCVVGLKDVKLTTKLIQNLNRNGSLSPAFTISASKVDLKTPKPVADKNIDLEDLTKELEQYLNNLGKLGFTEVLCDLIPSD